MAAQPQHVLVWRLDWVLPGPPFDCLSHGHQHSRRCELQLWVHHVHLILWMCLHAQAYPWWFQHQWRAEKDVLDPLHLRCPIPNLTHLPLRYSVRSSRLRPVFPSHTLRVFAPTDGKKHSQKLWAKLDYPIPTDSWKHPVIGVCTRDAHILSNFLWLHQWPGWCKRHYTYSHVCWLEVFLECIGWVRWPKRFERSSADHNGRLLRWRQHILTQS